MKLRLRNRPGTFDAAACRPLARGGEGSILSYPGDPGVVVKLYHRPSAAQEAKLRVMIANPPAQARTSSGHHTFAWPGDIVEDETGAFRGYVMPRITSLIPLIRVYNPAERKLRCPDFNHRYLLSTARNIASAVEAIHGAGYVIGDVNESNILVAPTTLVTLVDTDSFQVCDPRTGAVHLCHVGKEEYQPPELVGANFKRVRREAASDLFGLAVLMHQLLLEGAHPFAGVYHGAGADPGLAERIKRGYFPHARLRHTPLSPKPATPPLTDLDRDIAELFMRCFDAGHRAPGARPSAREWRKALRAAESRLVSCAANPNHVHSSQLASCPWCERARRFADPFPRPSTKARVLAPVAGAAALAVVGAGRQIRPPLRHPAPPRAIMPRQPSARALVRPATIAKVLLPLLMVATAVALGHCGLSALAAAKRHQAAPPRWPTSQSDRGDVSTPDIRADRGTEKSLPRAVAPPTRQARTLRDPGEACAGPLECECGLTCVQGVCALFATTANARCNTVPNHRCLIRQGPGTTYPYWQDCFKYAGDPVVVLARSEGRWWRVVACDTREGYMHADVLGE